MIRKTYDEKIDSLIEKLTSPWDSGPTGGYEFVVSAEVAAEAAQLILNLYERMEMFEAAHYNDQISG